MRLHSFIAYKFKGMPSSSFVNRLFDPPCYAFQLFYDKKGPVTSILLSLFHRFEFYTDIIVKFIIIIIFF